MVSRARAIQLKHKLKKFPEDLVKERLAAGLQNAANLKNRNGNSMSQVNWIFKQSFSQNRDDPTRDAKLVPSEQPVAKPGERLLVRPDWSRFIDKPVAPWDGKSLFDSTGSFKQTPQTTGIDTKATQTPVPTVEFWAETWTRPPFGTTVPQAGTNVPVWSEFWEYLWKKSNELWFDMSEFVETSGVDIWSLEQRYKTAVENNDQTTLKLIDTYVSDIANINKAAVKKSATLGVQKDFILSSFQNWQEVMGMIEAMDDAIEQWASTIEEVSEMSWLTKEQVRNIQSGRFDRIATPTSEIGKDLQEDYDKAIQRLEQDYEINKQEGMLALNMLTEDFERNAERQKEVNNIIESNTLKIAGLTWSWFSSWGIRGIERMYQNAKNTLDDMKRLYSRAYRKTQQWLDSLQLSYKRKQEDIADWLRDGINEQINSYFAGMQSIKDRFGEVSAEAQLRLNQATTNFLSNMDQIHSNQLDRFQAVNQEVRTEMSFLQEQQFELERFEQERLNNLSVAGMNMSLPQVAEMLQSGEISPQWARQMSSMMLDGTIDALSSFSEIPGLGNQFMEEIKNGLNQGKTPNWVLNEILVSDRYRSVKEAKQLEEIVGVQVREHNGKVTMIPSSVPLSFFRDGKGWFSSILDLSWIEPMPTGAVSYQENEEARILESVTLADGTNLVPGQSKAPWVLWQIGSGIIRQFGWWENGGIVDIDGEIGDPIFSVNNWTVHDVGTDRNGNRFVEVLANDGYIYRYNHLSDWNAQRWDSVVAGQEIGAMWNTWNVVSLWSDGSHLDIAIYDSVKNNQWIQRARQQLALSEQAEVLFGGKRKFKQFSDGEIEYLTSLTANAAAKEWLWEERKELQDYRSFVFSNPDADPVEMLRLSAGMKWKVSADTQNKLSTADQVFTWLDKLVSLYQTDEWFWPVFGKIRKKLWKIDATRRDIEIVTESLLAPVAKWVFWEKGVLTDQDIARYAWVIPNIEDQGAVRNFGFALMGTYLQRTLEKTIVSEARRWVDVSKYIGDYLKSKELSQEYFAKLSWPSSVDVWDDSIDLDALLEEYEEVTEMKDTSLYQ